MNDERQIALRVNAIYNNPKTINFLGFNKNKETEVKYDYSATIFKYDKEGNETDAFMDFKANMPVKGDLILTVGKNFTKWNNRDQYTIEVYNGFMKSAYVDEEQRERYMAKMNAELISDTKPEAVEAPKVEEPKQESPIDDVPWNDIVDLF